MKAEPPNDYRLRNAGLWSSTDAHGMNGAFEIPLNGFGHRIIAHCIVSDSTGLDDTSQLAGWEHVSVHIQEYGKQRVPTWAEMCAVKDIFWSPEETVVQFHPPKSEYVNNHPFVLHLWRYKKCDFPRPHHSLVGIKDL